MHAHLTTTACRSIIFSCPFLQVSRPRALVSLLSRIVPLPPKHWRQVRTRRHSRLLPRARRARGTPSFIYVLLDVVSPPIFSVCTSSRFLSGWSSIPAYVENNRFLPISTRVSPSFRRPNHRAAYKCPASCQLTPDAWPVPARTAFPVDKGAPGQAICTTVLPLLRQPRSARRPLATTAAWLAFGERRCECAPWRRVHCTLSYSHSLTPLPRPASRL
ncbi:hypothetical protein VUR80DRAFT_6797 [Thermomyces stellatus]